MSVNGESKIFVHESWVITPPIRCSQSYRNLWPPLYAKQIAIPSLPHLENECHQSVNNILSCILGNHTADRLHSVIEEFLATVIGKEIAIPSLPHREYECQQSNNNSWSCILGNHTANRLQSVIQELLAAIINKTDCITVPAPSWKSASTEHQKFPVMHPG